MNRKLVLFPLLLVLFAAPIFAVTITDTAQNDFNAGTFTQTNAPFAGEVRLNEQTSETYFLTGQYTSDIFDANQSTKWFDIEFHQGGNYQKELPNNKGVESDADMTSNVLLMHFNSTNGAFAVDSSGEGNDGTLINSAGLTSDGRFNSAALEVDGVNEQVSVNDSATLDITGDLTITMWVKPNASQNTLATLLSKRDDANTGFSIEMNGVANSNEYFFGWRNADANNMHCTDTNSFTLTPGTYQHLALVKAGPTRTAYVNLKEVSRCTAASAAILPNDAGLEIGNFTRETNHVWGGKIDELALFNQALTTTQLLRQYSRGVLSLEVQARTCDDALCSGESFAGPDGTVSTFFVEDQDRAWDLNTFANNRYVQYRAFFATEDGNISQSLTPTLLDVTITFNTAPDFNITTIDGFDDSVGLPFFSQEEDGNLSIGLAVIDLENDTLNADLYFSSTNTQGSGTRLFNDLTVNPKCTGTDLSALSTCTIDVNTAAFNLSDGNYFVLIELTDGQDTQFQASDNSFLIDNTKPSITTDANATYQETDANVQISVMDNLSGVDVVWITKDGVAEQFGTGFTDLNAFFNTDGNHSLDINAIDRAGNVWVQNTQYVLIDRTIPEWQSIPTQTVDITRTPSRLVDLFTYAFDQGSSDEELTFRILNQSNPGAIDCFLEFDRFLSCSKPQQLSSSFITIRVEDPAGKQADTTFEVNVTQSDVTVSFGFEEAAIANNETIGLSVFLKNNSNQTRTGSIMVDTNSPFVEGTTPNASFTLAPGQELQKTITLEAINAQSGAYPIFVTATYDTGAFVNSFDLRIGSFSSIEIVQFNQSVCRRGEQDVGIQIRNNSSTFKRVELTVGNEILLPSITPVVNLDAFESMFVPITITSSRTTGLGDYEISVFAKTEEELVMNMIDIELVECGSNTLPTFSVSIENSSGCFDLDKNEGTTIDFSITNRSDSEETVFATLISELPTNIKRSTISLEPNTARSLSFDVNASLRTEDGKYDVSLVVWNGNHSVERTVCVEVDKIHFSEVKKLNDNLRIEQGKNGVFTLLVRNIGDFDEDYEIEATHSNSNIVISISDDDFELDENGEKEVYISVTANSNLAPGRYDVNTLVRAHGDRFVRTLNFNVVAPTTTSSAELGITVYPLQTRMANNGTHTIQVEIKNTGTDRIRNASIELQGLPASIAHTRLTGLDFLGGETKNITLTLTTQNASPGTYRTTILASSGLSSDRAPMEIIVNSSGSFAGNTGGLGTGFFGLGGSSVEVFGIIAWVIIGIIVLLIIVGLISSNGPTRREVWMRRNNQ